MKNAIIIHGTSDKDEYYSPEYPSASNSHWLPWLQKQLIIRDIFTVTPEIPWSYMPDYKVWKREFERFDITLIPFWLVIVVALVFWSAICRIIRV